LQNTVNLIDGVDGLAAGVVAIVAATLLLAAINRGETDIVTLAGALIGACVGFLFFNWHPARVFMGDSGSNFLGFTLAALSVLSVAKGTVVLALVVPVVALAIPIVDTAWRSSAAAVAAGRSPPRARDTCPTGWSPSGFGRRRRAGSFTSPPPFSPRAASAF